MDMKTGFHFLDTKQNMILDGAFTKLIYVDAHFTMNSVFIACTCVKKSFHKTIASANSLEKELLSQYAQRKQCFQKKGICKVEGHLSSKKVKWQEGNDLFIIKISGVWETDSEYGLTYKLFPNVS